MIEQRRTSSPAWVLRERDVAFFHRELDGFVPPNVFDAHIHLGPRDGYGPLHATLMANTPTVVDLADYRRHLEWLMPGRELAGALAIPNRLAGEDMEEGNRLIAAESPGCHALVVSPRQSAEHLRSAVVATRPVALKCYHLMAEREDSLQCELGDYLTDAMAEVANAFGLSVIVHLVRSTALADAGNQRAIRDLCRRYPDLKLVLAHAARGFNPSHTIRGLEGIGGLDNVFFDSSSVCESAAFEAILRSYGPSRLMWGSDYPFSHLHGRCIAVDDAFIWLYDHTLDPGPLSPDPELKFVLVGLESLRALKQACRARGLSDAEVEGVFRGNAERVFGRDG